MCLSKKSLFFLALFLYSLNLYCMLWLLLLSSGSVMASFISAVFW